MSLLVVEYHALNQTLGASARSETAVTPSGVEGCARPRTVLPDYVGIRNDWVVVPSVHDSRTPANPAQKRRGTQNVKAWRAGKFVAYVSRPPAKHRGGQERPWLPCFPFDRSSRLTSHFSLLTIYAPHSHFTTYESPFSSSYSAPTLHLSTFFLSFISLSFHGSLITIHCSRLTLYFLLFTSYYSLVTNQHSLITIYHIHSIS
jgi:hypothetical protein